MRVMSSQVLIMTLTFPLALCRWQFLTGSTSTDNVGSSDVPSARYAPATCYDYKTNSILLFGGYSSTLTGKGYLADLWKYDIGSNTWQNLVGAGVGPNSTGNFTHMLKYLNKTIFTGEYTGSANVLRPASRSEAILLCNSKDDRVFLFGGTGRNPNDLSEDAELVSYNDFWGFRSDAKTWFILRGQGVGPLNGETNNLPRARSLGAAAISEDKGVIYLYSGYDRRSMTYLNDLWSGSYTANSVTWSRLLYDPKRSFPLGTRGLFMDYDKVGDQLIVYGGESSEGLKSDVWAFSFSGLLSWRILSGNDLKNEKVNVKTPGGRARMAAAFDPELRQIVMHGGECTADGESRGVCNDVWIFNIVTRLWTFQDGKFGKYDVSSLYDSSSDRKGEFGSRHGTGTVLVPASGVNQANTAASWIYVFGGSTETGTNQPSKLHNDMWRFLSKDDPVSVIEPKPTTTPVQVSPADYSRNLGFENESTGISLFIAIGLVLLFVSMYYWYTKYKIMVETALKDKEDFKKSIARANEGRNASYKPVETTQDSLEPAIRTDRSDKSSDKPKDKAHTRKSDK
ncbi:hypothetical protein MP638_006838 [Amoeboaphelidium occidentale]|nr:hypothetical protein MP638_006838 [Amoeboaphelidium occidentale]